MLTELDEENYDRRDGSEALSLMCRSDSYFRVAQHSDQMQLDSPRIR